MSGSSQTTTPPGGSSEDDGVDALFIGAMVCCAVGGILIIFGILRIIYFCYVLRRDKKMKKRRERQLQQIKYLEDYAKKPGTLSVDPYINSQHISRHKPQLDSPRSWQAGSNPGFDWNDIGTSHTYVTDGTLVKVRESSSTRPNSTVPSTSAHSELMLLDSSRSSFNSLQPGRDRRERYIDTVIVDDPVYTRTMNDVQF